MSSPTCKSSTTSAGTNTRRCPRCPTTDVLATPGGRGCSCPGGWGISCSRSFVVRVCGGCGENRAAATTAVAVEVKRLLGVYRGAVHASSVPPAVVGVLLLCPGGWGFKLPSPSSISCISRSGLPGRGLWWANAAKLGVGEGSKLMSTLCRQVGNSGSQGLTGKVD